MTDYRVQLDSYNGPLDLLLYLVRRHEIDLHDIPIAQLTEQYLEHLKMMDRIDVERVGEFLVMAATLLEIKSALLVPKTDNDADPSHSLGDGDGADPRHALVQQLMAYKRFRDAATYLDERRHQWEQCYPFKQLRADPATINQAQPIEYDLEDANVMDLCQAYSQMLDSVGRNRLAVHEVIYDDTPVALHAEDIVDRLSREGPMSLQAMFVGRASQSEKIGLFLATLELVRRSRILLVQDEINQQIELTLQEREDEDDVDQLTVQDGSIVDLATS